MSINNNLKKNEATYGSLRDKVINQDPHIMRGKCFLLKNKIICMLRKKITGSYFVYNIVQKEKKKLRLDTRK